MGDYLSTPIKTKDCLEGGNPRLNASICGMQGWRKSMEDDHVFEINLLPDKDISLFGVFDGHGGYEVAKYAAKHISSILIELDSFKKGNYGDALIETFLQIDNDMKTELGKKELLKYSKDVNINSMATMARNEGDDISNTTGCTACVALITKDKIFVANSGDSRSVLSQLGVAVDMSTDHKPDLPNEKARIEKAKGTVIANRINGGLNVSRTLGDFDFKNNQALSADEQLVIARPDIKEEKLTPVCDFLIIGCDGIWDCLTSQKAVEFIKERIEKSEQASENVSLKSIIEEMMETIIAKDAGLAGGIGCDNMTCIIVKFKKR